MHQITSARAEVNLRCVRNERGTEEPASGGEGTSVACAGACSVEVGVGLPSSRVGEETAGSALHQCQGYPPELHMTKSVIMPPPELGPARSVPSRPVVGPAALVPSIAAGSSVPRSQEGVYIIIARNS